MAVAELCWGLLWGSLAAVFLFLPCFGGAFFGCDPAFSAVRLSTRFGNLFIICFSGWCPPLPRFFFHWLFFLPVLAPAFISGAPLASFADLFSALPRRCSLVAAAAPGSCLLLVSAFLPLPIVGLIGSPALRLRSGLDGTPRPSA